jgi:hypothetical protein
MKPNIYSFGIVAVISATIAYGLYLSSKTPAVQTSSETAEASSAVRPGLEMDEEDHPISLNIPLEQTNELRPQLVKAIKDRGTFVLRDIYEEWVSKVGVNGIIRAIDEVEPECHDRGHDLGKVIYAELKDIPESLRACQNSCNSGCMHGVMMEAFTEQKPDLYPDDGIAEHITLEDIDDKINEICTLDEVDGDYPYGDCLHGVGHALMFLADYDIDLGISYCDQFDDPRKAYYCATGGYMEYVGLRDIRDTEFEELFYPCPESEHPAACFRYKMVYVFYRHYASGGVGKDLILQCLNYTGLTRLGCFHGVGNAHIGYIVHGQTNLTDVCSYGNQDDQYACIEGAMERMTRYHPEEAKQVCATQSGWKHDVCEQARNNGMYSLDKDFSYYITA